MIASDATSGTQLIAAQSSTQRRNVWLSLDYSTYCERKCGIGTGALNEFCRSSGNHVAQLGTSLFWFQAKEIGIPVMRTLS